MFFLIWSPPTSFLSNPQELYTLFYKADSTMDDIEDLLDAERVGEPPLKKSRPAQLKERADSAR